MVFTKTSRSPFIDERSEKEIIMKSRIRIFMALGLLLLGSCLLA